MAVSAGAGGAGAGTGPGAAGWVDARADVRFWFVGIGDWLEVEGSVSRA